MPRAGVRLRGWAGRAAGERDGAGRARGSPARPLADNSGGDVLGPCARADWAADFGARRGAFRTALRCLVANRR